MTTVTIDRKLLKEVLAVLEKSSCAVGYESETAWLNANSKIRAALAAPATAPQKLDPIRSELPSERAKQVELPQRRRYLATAPEKTVQEIMEFARHYAANTFSSATLEDKIRRSLATPATDDRHRQELLAMEITLQKMNERHAQELCAYQITVDKLRAAPSWHDAPTCPGLWVLDDGTALVLESWALPKEFDGLRWFGPIPSDSGDKA